MNRELVFCLREANSHFHQLGRGLNTPFYYEARNQPSPDHEKKYEREDKRPDFQNGFVDHTEPDPKKQDKHFCIECKRLGFPSSSAWIINRNYTVYGIARFLNGIHGYGLEVESGAMVGYVESSNFDSILEEVNTSFHELFPQSPYLRSSANWDTSIANVLEHTLERDFPISPFRLKHYWIDLRGKLAPSLPKPGRKTSTDKSQLDSLALAETSQGGYTDSPSNEPNCPDPHFSASLIIRRLYSALKRRRCAFAGTSGFGLRS